MDLMLDLETFGTKQGCVVRSIGAVSFKLSRKGCVTKKRFYANLTEDDQIAMGLVKDPDTVKWWSRQTEAAQNAFLVDQKPVSDVLESLTAFIKDEQCDHAWSQGSSFDLPIVSELYDRSGLKFPVPFSAWMDTRTAYRLAKTITNKIPRKGTFHNALDDCDYQVRCLSESMSRLYTVMAIK